MNMAVRIDAIVGILVLLQVFSILHAQPLTVPLVTLPRNQADTCPPVDDKETAIEKLTMSAMNAVQHRSIVPECGDGIWLQIADLNVQSDPSQQCPTPWREYSHPARSCGRKSTSTGSCNSVYYGTSGTSYNRVCGRATGYVVGSPDAFAHRTGQTINNNYVDGLSITYGSPRTHIWTFSVDQDVINSPRCFDPSLLSFLNGHNHFCDSSNNGPVWDGEDCTPQIPAGCTFNSPPWFSVQLSTSTTADIEVRICGNERTSNEDVPIGLLKLYVQ